MADGVSSEMKAQLMSDKLYHDSLSQAIRLAKNSGIDEKLIKPMMLEKQKYKKICAENVYRVLRAMPLATNVVQLEGGWHAIRYTNQGAETMVKIEIIHLEDVKLIMRDARHERDLSRNELDTLTPAMIDEYALEIYKRQLYLKAVDLVEQFTGVYVEAPASPTSSNTELAETEKATVVSVHAGRRYVQRVLGIGVKNDAEADEYRRAHLNEVNQAVLEGFNNAELVWEEKVDDITYWFDSQNYMYVKGKQDGVPKIITMYEENFGFSKEINRLITFEQLRVLGDARRELHASELDAGLASSLTDNRIQEINDQIALLESQIALLVSERSEQTVIRDKANRTLKVSKDKYAIEFNKLFKKWDV